MHKWAQGYIVLERTWNMQRSGSFGKNKLERKGLIYLTISIQPEKSMIIILEGGGAYGWKAFPEALRNSVKSPVKHGNGVTPRSNDLLVMQGFSYLQAAKVRNLPLGGDCCVEVGQLLDVQTQFIWCEGQDSFSE